MLEILGVLAPHMLVRGQEKQVLVLGTERTWLSQRNKRRGRSL
jgi:hypothetical protein